MVHGDLTRLTTFTEEYETITPKEEECCIYTFILDVVTNLGNSQRIMYEVKDFEISCECGSCDTEEKAEHYRFLGHSPPFESPYIHDRFTVVRKCPCTCEDCMSYLGKPCKIIGDGFKLEEGHGGPNTTKDFHKILEGDGDWDELPGLIDDWKDAGDVIESPQSPNSTCDLPIPSGWMKTVDMPTNLYELDCCENGKKSV